MLRWDRSGILGVAIASPISLRLGALCLLPLFDGDQDLPNCSLSIDTERCKRAQSTEHTKLHCLD
jgi:hypothetical protein